MLAPDPLLLLELWRAFRGANPIIIFNLAALGAGKGQGPRAYPPTIRDACGPRQRSRDGTPAGPVSVAIPARRRIRAGVPALTYLSGHLALGTPCSSEPMVLRVLHG